MLNKGTTEREKGKQEIDSHKRAAWEVVKENPSLAATGRDQIPSHVTALLLSYSIEIVSGKWNICTVLDAHSDH